MEDIGAQLDLFDQIVDEVEFADRRYDKGIVNQETGAAVLLRGDGEISLSAGATTQYKIIPGTGDAVEISTASHTITNRKHLTTDEILVNKHKANPRLYEYADMRQIFNDPAQAIGNLLMGGTVLVKAWEPSLKKYVLIRRAIRMPLFSQLLNIADAPEEYGINTDISGELEEMINKRKGE